MVPLERLIELIEKGDSVSILAETDLQNCFDELLKHELIDIIGDKVVVTIKGKEAKAAGWTSLLLQVQKQKQLRDMSKERAKTKLRSTVLPVIVFLGIFVLVVRLVLVIS